MGQASGIGTRAGGLQLIETGELVDYPLDLAERLEGRFYMAWHHDRWLNSRFRLSAPPDVRGLAIDLFSLAQKQTPVGTLPDDDVQLAALLLLDLKTWQSYRARDWSPLYHWVPCRCGGEIRLMHSVVLEVIEEAIGIRTRRVEDAEVARRKKRLDRLPQQILDAGGTKAMANSADLLEWVDNWLEKNARGYRTRIKVRQALEVHSTSVAL